MPWAGGVVRQLTLPEATNAPFGYSIDISHVINSPTGASTQLFETESAVFMLPSECKVRAGPQRTFMRLVNEDLWPPNFQGFFCQHALCESLKRSVPRFPRLFEVFEQAN